ncbi:hypothetical protein DRN43_02090 [Thermococci archaeon]|uniref:hypothetical protein n=1 Tax=Palaeococcus sp. (in: euryarchaeotes) TaxID=2820298 RepID=UPI000F2455D9|nr:hypothetical protein [Palaeococcus sp. (in: euryarchaeotes)]MCD6558925.1 hypothetical protein [Palaeococcus sp. (in: euryarchaeotes)]RLF90253.1 MAG: hypothetical protein DRN43_02090 [Thermococci archaeon]
MRVHSLWVMAIPFLLIASFASSYIVRWASLLVAGVILLAIFIWEVPIRYRTPKRIRKEENGKTEFERIVSMIKLAEKGGVARSLVEDRIIGIYEILEDKGFDEIKKSPNRALRILRQSDNFLEGLEKALDVLEREMEEMKI